MPKRGQGKTAAKTTAAKVGYEAELWQMDGVLRGSRGTADKCVLLAAVRLERLDQEPDYATRGDSKPFAASSAGKLLQGSPEARP